MSAWLPHSAHDVTFNAAYDCVFGQRWFVLSTVASALPASGALTVVGATALRP